MSLGKFHKKADAILARYGVLAMARVSLQYLNTKTEFDETSALIREAITH